MILEKDSVGRNLVTPFPWFGGKARVADEVWKRFGTVSAYREPFAGGIAVLLRNPHPPKDEVITDVNHYIVNFWRAIRDKTQDVLKHLDLIRSEADLFAIHRYLSVGPMCDSFKSSIEHDPEFSDAKFAAWWVYGQSIWIGHGWCNGRSFHRRKRQHFGPSGVFTEADIRDRLVRLKVRLQRLNVIHGDWKRGVSSDAALSLCRSGTRTTGVFIDPPYPTTDRHELYSSDIDDQTEQIRQEVFEWCLKRGDDPRIKIAVCGFESDYAELEQYGWEKFQWQTQGGFAHMGRKDSRGMKNRSRETIWFNPSCSGDERSLV